MKLTAEERAVARMLGLDEDTVLASKMGQRSTSSKPSTLATASQPSKPATSLRPSTSPSALTEAERHVAELMQLDPSEVQRAKERDSREFAKRGRAEAPESGPKLAAWRSHYLADDSSPGWTQS